MNLTNSFQSADFEHSDAARGGKEKLRTSRRQPSHARSGARPASHNGIHRRRNKRFSW
jgi:hypothetical protein